MRIHDPSFNSKATDPTHNGVECLRTGNTSAEINPGFIGGTHTSGVGNSSSFSGGVGGGVLLKQHSLDDGGALLQTNLPSQRTLEHSRTMMGRESSLNGSDSGRGAKTPFQRQSTMEYLVKNTGGGDLSRELTSSLPFGNNLVSLSSRDNSNLSLEKKHTFDGFTAEQNFGLDNVVSRMPVGGDLAKQVLIERSQRGGGDLAKKAA